MKIKKYLLLIFSLSLLTSCEDYMDINKSTTGVTDEDLEAGGLNLWYPTNGICSSVLFLSDSPSKTTGPVTTLQ